ncbi:MAG: ABC transporter permease [Sedimentisphaerales bacterium]|jgi:ribose transport system permease protein
MKKELGIFAMLVVLCIVVAILNPLFLSVMNLQNTARLVGMFGIFSIGVGVVIITGGIDLSVGSLFALFGVLLSFMLMRWGWPWPLAIGAILLIAIAIGVFHGFLVTKMNLQSFIVTLCGLLFYRGLARYIAEDQTLGFGYCTGFETLQKLTTGEVLGVPMPFVLLIIISFIMWVVLHRSVYGRYLFAVGRNEEAARFSGINTSLVIASSYVVSALMAGIGAILLAFYTNSISPSSHGNFYELYAIAAAVLGGCSLRGGEGSVIGICIGAALLQVLQNLVNLLGIPSSLNFAVMGTVILIGVITDQILGRRKAKS